MCPRTSWLDSSISYQANASMKSCRAQLFMALLASLATYQLILRYDFTLREPLPRLQYRSAHDRSRQYKIRPFALVGRGWDDDAPASHVCLATQASLDRLHWLARLADAWSGQLSVALFVPGHDYHLALAYVRDYLLKCRPELEKRAAFHLVFPADRPIKVLPKRLGINLQCGGCPEEYVQTLLKLRPVPAAADKRKELVYPQNLLRNVARSSCQAPFSIVSDVDMIPSANLSELLGTSKIVTNATYCRKKCAYVIPVYEVDANSSSQGGLYKPPGTKEALLKWVQKGKARQYHKQVFDLNQGATDFKKWETIDVNETGEVTVAYEVAKFGHFYEPIYLARSTPADAGQIPEFDERFVGYGMTRSSQALEMFAAGFQFSVLNIAYFTHRGFSELRQTYTQVRWKQLMKNKARFCGFVRELAVKYGSDKERLVEEYARNCSRQQ